MENFIEQFKKEIQGFTPESRPANTGVVVRVGDGVAEIEGLAGAVMSEMIRFETYEGKPLERALEGSDEVFGILDEKADQNEKIDPEKLSIAISELKESAGKLQSVLDKYPHQLSGGMRQRILIAIALSCRPKLLIADELTTALDVTVQAQILQLLRKQSASTSLILITHDLGVVAQTCKRVLVLYGGKIVESGPVDQILHAPRHPYTQMLLRSLPRLEKDKSEALEAIEGSAPNLLMPPSGCPFAERCPHAMPLCQTPPPFVNNTACWMVYQSRPKTWNLGDSEESRFEGSRREGYCINISDE